MLYHRSAYAPTAVNSYWQATLNNKLVCEPLKTEAHYEVVIIGAGYTGLSAALHLVRDYGVDVCVLESAQPGWGASGRNGGFCCIGSSKLSYQQMIKRYGLSETQSFFNIQREAVDLVAELAKDEHIDIDASGNGEIELAHKPSRVRELKQQQQFLHNTFALETTFHEADELIDLGLVSAECYGGLYNPLGFGVHPLKYVTGLANTARRYGAKIYGDSKVLRWEKYRNWHVLHTEQGKITAEKVIIASNAYSEDNLYPELKGRLLPVLSNIIVTRRLSEQELQEQGWFNYTMAYDSRILLHYFRLLPDQRFLFGGRGGTSATPADAIKMKSRLNKEFQQMFPAWRDVATTHFWRGLACMAYDLVPHISRLDEHPSVLLSLAYHGNGVAMASWSGRMLARLCVDYDNAIKTVPALMRRMPPKFPLPDLRLLYLQTAYAGYGVKDRFL